MAVIDSYIKNGWVFTAARLRKESTSDDRLTPHPLTFKFKTDQPVYPLRLTGVGNDDCRIDLHVAGARRAAAPPFTVERCGKLDRGRKFERKDRIYCDHPAMRELTDGAAVITRLNATLSPKEMTDDLTIGWEPYRHHELLKFTRSAALELGFNVAFSFLLTVGIIWLMRKPLPKVSLRVLGPTIVIAAALVAVTYAALPTIHTRSTNWFKDSIRMSMTRNLGDDIERRIKNNPDIPVDLDQIRVWIKEAMRDDEEYERFGPIHEEDSPGNYTLEERDGKIIYTIYGRYGGADSAVIWPLDEEEP